MKKAFLVTFCPTTRVVVDIKDEKLVFEKDYNNVVFSAVEKIMNNNLYDYFSLENVEKIELDEELPYPQDFDL